MPLLDWQKLTFGKPPIFENYYTSGLYYSKHLPVISITPPMPKFSNIKTFSEIILEL